MQSEYEAFIAAKKRLAGNCGFEISDSDINQRCHPFQRDIIKWACRRGSAGLFEDCGFGKTLQQLEWARLVCRHAGGKVLLLCPLAVADQTLREAVKFGIDCSVGHVRSMDDCHEFDICITNYERLHLFNPSYFVAVVLDESSILKGMNSKTRVALNDAFGRHRYKLACTATPAPNDNTELGNHAEFLGVMQASVMLSQFFIHDGGDTSKWRLKGHAKSDYWNWVASWAIALNKPSDIGYDDAGYDLPEMRLHEHFVGNDAWFGVSDKSLSATTIYESKAKTLKDRCTQVADLANGDDDYWAVWCDTNAEADLLKKTIKGNVEVRGSDDPDEKSAKLSAFSRGEVRVMITKAEIGGFGLNWQHCHKTTFFASYSFERWYQAVRRLWRYGQIYPVDVHMIASHEEHGVSKILKRKQEDFDSMAREMSIAMKEGMLQSLYGRTPLREYAAGEKMTLPKWMVS